MVMWSADVHLFVYPTHSVTVVINFAPASEITVKGWGVAAADGSGMVIGWYYHNTMEAAWKSAVDAATTLQSQGDKVNMIHHDCT